MTEAVIYFSRSREIVTSKNDRPRPYFREEVSHCGGLSVSDTRYLSH